MKQVTSVLFVLCCMVFATSSSHATLIGPSGGSGISGEYASIADSPFSVLDFSGGYWHLEDFEDHLFNTPGVTADNGGPTSVVFSPAIHDSVDMDDSVLDGSGLAGDSFFFDNGATGVTFTFSASVLGLFPTHVGVVWTDGDNTITFEAFDANGVSLGTRTGNHATNGSYGGQTSEDRFYGAINVGGISAIKLSNGSGGIELDHLQYGNMDTAPVPEPATMLLFGTGLAGLVGSRIRRRRKA